MTIYIVTHWDYSDYSIRAVFTTREAAQAWIDRGGKGCIEEWKADEEAEFLPRTVFACRMRIEDGAWEEWSYDGGMASPVLRTPSTPCIQKGSITLGRACPVAKAESYISAEHAQKLAAEARQEYL